ncbi:MAG: heparan-alpha-glucosaminide N-acetyltransferase domain-containing protein [Vicinamibacterales bacterium]
MAFDAAGHRLPHHLRGRALTTGDAPRPRREWLDWARGLAVVLMVLAHVVDAWTRGADRDRTAFYWATFFGGLAAPAFLFLAGLGSALSGASKLSRGGSRSEVTRLLVWRGVTIFGLAFAFRVQAFILGLGHPVDLLKVDILNVMGPSLVVAAIVWGLGAGPVTRVLMASMATMAVAFTSPLVRAASWIEALPAPMQWYLRPTPGHTNFTLLPWAAFVTAGLAVGVALAAVRSDAGEQRLQAALGALAVGGVAAAWWASFQPSIYAPGVSTFWGPSPTFFFIRLGIVTAFLPLCWLLRRAMPARVASLLATLGASSLFVYWVHVELVYGGIAILIKRHLPFELTLVATAVVAYGMARLVPVAKAWVARRDERPVLARQLVARLL